MFAFFYDLPFSGFLSFLLFLVCFGNACDFLFLFYFIAVSNHSEIFQMFFY